MAEADFSKLHGLIIGIDEYQNRENLGGCVNDANRVFEYFTTKLGVPQDQLVQLSNEQATRQNIIDTFKDHLILNKNIRPSDPILFYFAGHGQQVNAPPEWHHANGKTEMILPHDADTRCGVSEQCYEDFIYGIPDRTLGALIRQLYEAWGDNITIILDSCHSGSCTRGGLRVRTSIVEYPMIPPTLDDDIIGSVSLSPEFQCQQMSANKEQYGKFTAPSQAPSLETHVLLSACQSVEQALEIPGAPSSGLFTDSLLEALQTLDLATTSYFALIRKVQEIARKWLQSKGFPPGAQTPQCEGRKQDRLLFCTQFAHSKGRIPLIRGKSNTFAIPAGSASGIQRGTELAVYHGNMSKESEPLGLLVAARVEAMASMLIPKGSNSTVEWPKQTYVVVTKYTGYTVRIFADDRIKQNSRWQEILGKVQTWPIDIVWSKPGEPCDLILRLVEGGIEIDRSDPSILQLKPLPVTLPNSISEAGLEDILPQMGHFHFHLQRRNPSSPLAGQVEMKLIELKHMVNKAGYEPIEPVRDLFGNSLSDGTVVELKADTRKRYGLQLINRSNSPLYAWVIYFDLGDYSIQFMYNPPSRTMSPPLAANKDVVFPVGYGDSGSEPLRIENTTGGRETGVFMLFVTSKWVDIEHIEQDPIIQVAVDPKGRRDDLGEKPKLENNCWDVLTVGVSMSM